MYYMSMRIHTHTFLIIRGEKTVFFYLFRNIRQKHSDFDYR